MRYIFIAVLIFAGAAQIALGIFGEGAAAAVAMIVLLAGAVVAFTLMEDDSNKK